MTPEQESMMLRAESAAVIACQQFLNESVQVNPRDGTLTKHEATKFNTIIEWLARDMLPDGYDITVDVEHDFMATGHIRLKWVRRGAR